MKTIEINFSQGLAKHAKTASLAMLVVLVLATCTSLVMLFRGSAALVDYVAQHRNNQQGLQANKLDYDHLAERVIAHMRDLPASIGSQASGCGQATFHLNEIEHHLPKQAVLNRFQFSPAAGVVTATVVTSSSSVLGQFVEGIESGGRYTDVRVKQKSNRQGKQYEVQYRCMS